MHLFERRKSNPSAPVSTENSPSDSMRNMTKPEKTPIKFAFLNKDGGFQKMYWDKRYFVLWSNGELEYYKNVPVPQNEKELADLSKGEFKGSINVLECQIKSGKPRSKKDFVLELSLAERTFYIGFDSSIEMLVWDGAMRQVAFKLESKKTPEQRRNERKNRTLTSIKRNKDGVKEEVQEEAIIVNDAWLEEKKALETSLENCKTQITSLTQEKKVLEDLKGDLEMDQWQKIEEIKELKSKITQFEKDFETLKLSLDQRIQDIESHHKEERDRLKHDLVEQIEKYSKLQNDHLSEQKDDHMIQQVQALQTSERDLNEKLRLCREKNNEITNSLKSRDTTITTLTEINVNLRQQVDQLVIESKNAQSLVLQIETLKKENAQMKDKMTQMTSRICTLKDEKAFLVSKTVVSKPTNPKVANVLERISRNDSKLVDVELMNVDMIDDEFKSICTALIQNTVCKKMDISNNKRINGKTSIDEMCKVLLQNKTLEEVVMDGCPIERDGIKKMIAALEKNFTMLQMTCGSCETDSDINAVEDLLDRNYEKSKK